MTEEESNFMIMMLDHDDGQYADGFHMTFANGLTVSIRFGRNNYCENQRFGCDSVLTPIYKYMSGSRTGEKLVDSNSAEVGIWKMERPGIKWNGCHQNKRIWMTETVLRDTNLYYNRCSANTAAKIIGIVANWVDNGETDDSYWDDENECKCD